MAVLGPTQTCNPCNPCNLALVVSFQDKTLGRVKVAKVA